MRLLCQRQPSHGGRGLSLAEISIQRGTSPQEFGRARDLCGTALCSSHLLVLWDLLYPTLGWPAPGTAHTFANHDGTQHSSRQRPTRLAHLCVAARFRLHIAQPWCSRFPHPSITAAAVELPARLLLDAALRRLSAGEFSAPFFGRGDLLHLPASPTEAFWYRISLYVTEAWSRCSARTNCCFDCEKR